MAAINDILIPSLTFEEIASDGSTLSNPAADHRRVFLGEDGALHLRDSAGSVTDIGGGGLADQGAFTYLDATEAAAPGTPASGFARIYAKSDGRIYSKDDAGTEYGPFDAAGGGGGSGYIAAITAETGVTAYWPCNDGLGATTFVDAVGSADLTAQATTPGFGPALTNDTPAGSLHIFDNTMRVGRAALTWGAAFTYEAWVILTTNNAGAFGQWNGAGSMVLNSAGALNAYCGGTPITWTYALTDVAGKHHVAVTHDGTQLRLYWDGVLKAGPTTLTLPTTNVGGPFRLGTYNDTQAAGGIVIGDVAFYSGTALSAATLLAHAALGA